MVPLLTFRLRVTNAAAGRGHPQRRAPLPDPDRGRPGATTPPEEESRLRDLFGEPERWGQTLRAMLWTHASVVVPPFSGEAMADLPVACTYDFNVAATKYFYALEDGEIPLDFLFSGSVFYRGRRGRASGRADLLDPGSALPPAGDAPGSSLMDAYYPNIGVGPAPAGRVRPAVSVQGPSTAFRPGSRRSSACCRGSTRRRRYERGPRSSRSRARCCTRATCSTPTGGPR